MYGLRGRRRPLSDNEMQKNAMSLVACFQFLNTSVAILVASMNLKIDGSAHFLKIADGAYDDFNPEWFQACSAQIVMTFGVMIISPHVIPILQYTWYAFRRSYDSTGSAGDQPKTRQVIQGNYEQINIGCEFLAEKRLGQLVAIVWSIFTYLPAIPVLPVYMIAFLIVFYWLDKFMYLRFAGKPRNADEKTIGYAVHLMHYAFIWHGIAATFVLSNENIFSSRTYFNSYAGSLNGLLKTWSGGKLFIAERFTQGHLILFWAVLLLFWAALLFEGTLFNWFSKLPFFKSEIFYTPPYARTQAFCDDLYDLLDAKYLVKQYKRAVETKNDYIVYMGKRQHLPAFEACRAQFQAYLKRAIEKERLLAVKLRELTASWGGFPDMDARCERVLEDLPRANAERDARLRSPIQSYDLRDNEHYVAVLALQKVIIDSVGDPEDELMDEKATKDN